MNKQQTAEAKYPFHPEDDVKDKEEIRGLRDAHMRGWEACLATLSPSDAVVGGVSVLTDAFERIANNTAHPCSEERAYSWIETARGIAGEALKEFNPSGAAPQAEPTHTEALKHAKETLQWMFDNMTADDKRDVQDSHDRPLNAIHAIELALQSASTPPAAGPVWVRHSKKFPEDWISVINRNRHTKQVITEFDVEKAEGEYFLLEGGRTVYYYDCEWLDESSTQQVFTREQIDKISNAAMSRFKAYIPELTFQEWFDDFMNTNYPIKSPATGTVVK